MKKIKSWIVGAMALFVLMAVDAGAQAPSAGGQYQINTYIVRLPIRANGNWRPRAQEVANAVFSGTTSSIGDVGTIYNPSMISQRLPNLDNDTLWVVVDIRGLNGALINPNMTRYWQKSSDVTTQMPGGSLENSYNLVGTSSAWSPETLGQTASGEKISSGNGNVSYPRMVFVAFQGKYYTYANEAEEANVNNYVYGNNLSVMFGVDVVGFGGQTLATSSRTLTLGQPASNTTLSIRKSGTGVIVGFHAPPNRQITLQSSSMGYPAIWLQSGTSVPTGSSGHGEFPILSTGGGNMIFRAIVQ